MIIYFRVHISHKEEYISVQRHLSDEFLFKNYEYQTSMKKYECTLICTNKPSLSHGCELLACSDGYRISSFGREVADLYIIVQ